MKITKNLISRLTLVFATILTLASCAVEPVLVVNTESKQDLENYKTFSWVKNDPMYINGYIQPSEEASTAAMERIKSVLETKGYRFIDERANADFVVLFSVGASETTVFEKYPNYFSENLRWMSEFQDGGVEEVAQVKVLNAGIAINVFDREKREALWFGSAKKRLKEYHEASNLIDSEDLSESVQALLTEFPKAS
jgi:hypothetical protein